MDPPGLTSLPTELVHQLCRLLPMEDVESVSNSCVRLYDTLNDNRVWERFLDNKARGLESESQHLEPAFVPDPALCGNRKHLARQQHLLQNLQAKRFVRHEVDDGKICMGAKIYHKDNYIILLGTKQIQIWDTRNKPIQHCCLFLPSFMGFLTGVKYKTVVGDNLVVVKSTRVFVYLIDIEQKALAFRFSMKYIEDKVDYDISDIDEVSKTTADLAEYSEGEDSVDEDYERFYRNPPGKKFYVAKNYLVYQEENSDLSNKSLHVWNLDNAGKVGVFPLPKTHSNMYYHSWNDNDLFLNHWNGEKYFKFNFVSKTISTFKTERSYFHVLYFYKDHCIKLSKKHQKSLQGEVFNFETGRKLVGKCYTNMLGNEWVPSGNVIVGDKLVIAFTNRFLVADLLTLETLTVVPCDFQLSRVVSQVSLFGSIYVLAQGGIGDGLRLFDMEKGASVMITQFDCWDREVATNETFSKVALVHEDVGKMVTVHFW